MANVFDLDACEDQSGVDISIYIPGPAGPVGAQGPTGPSGGATIDVGSRASPVLVSSAIAAPVYQSQRSFIRGSTGPVYNPSIPNPSNNSMWSLYLFCTDDTNTITLEDQSNLQLSGEWIGKNGSIILLQWDGASKYVEGGRNEI